MYTGNTGKKVRKLSSEVGLLVNQKLNSWKQSPAPSWQDAKCDLSLCRTQFLSHVISVSGLSMRFQSNGVATQVAMNLVFSWQLNWHATMPFLQIYTHTDYYTCASLPHFSEPFPSPQMQHDTCRHFMTKQCCNLLWIYQQGIPASAALWM